MINTLINKKYKPKLETWHLAKKSIIRPKIVDIMPLKKSKKNIYPIGKHVSNIQGVPEKVSGYVQRRNDYQILIIY